MTKTRSNIAITILVSLTLLLGTHCFAMSNKTITSPNKHLKVKFILDDSGTPFYSVQLHGKEVLAPSALGLICSDGQAFNTALTLEKISASKKVKDDYTMLTGKRKQCDYRANRRTFTLKNNQGQTLQIIFQVSNDGLAFRYALPEESDKPLSVTEEKTAFAFKPTAISWLHPMQPTKTGWSRT